MGKPRSLAAAFREGFKVKNIYSKGNKQIRLDLERQFFKREEVNNFSIWIDRDYFQRTYPHIYDRFEY